jgi:pimeloyl-ACP methyl ester carboxylesterase/DNA-binding winged helix-turn-helix (wHTH) protein
MVFLFGPYRLDVHERRLFRDGESVALRSKAFDTLTLLVENHGKLLRKSDLMQRLWPNSIVEENNLDHNISALRKVLADGTNGSAYIETVPRQGYRFIAEVKPATPPSEAPAFHTVEELEPEDDNFDQEIRFFTASDGVRIAYAIAGSGPALVRAVDWINHIEFEWKNPFVRRWLKHMMKHHTVLRYDQRGSGLSDWNVQDFSFERTVRDLEELVDHCGLARFTCFGSCQGGAITAAYAARHPERVTSLLLMGSFARGWPAPDSVFANEFEAMLSLIKVGWGRDNPAFRQLWTTLFMPDATLAEMNWMNELQRITISPENAVRMMSEFPRINVLDLLPDISCPTLVMHSGGDATVPAQEGRLIASRIPGARFVELPSRRHNVRPGEPAFSDFLREMSQFLGWESRESPIATMAAKARPGT